MAVFNLDGSTLANILTKLIKVAPNGAEVVQLIGHTKKGVVEVRAFHENRVVIGYIKNQKDVPSFDFSCTGNRLLAIVKGKSKIQFNIKDNTLEFKAGYYKGSIEAGSLNVEVPDTKNIVHSEKLSEGMRFAISELSKTVALKSTISNKPLVVFINFSERGLTLACGDQVHMAVSEHSKFKVKEPPAVSAFPISYITFLKSLFDFKSQLDIKLTDSTLLVSDENFQILLPKMIIASDEATYEILTNFLDNTKETKKLAEATISVGKNSDSIVDAIAAMEAIKEADLSLNISLAIKKEVGIQVSASSRHGSLKEVLDTKTKGTGSIVLESKVLNDVLSRVTDKANLAIYEGNKCVITEQNTENQSLVYFLIMGLMEV